MGMRHQVGGEGTDAEKNALVLIWCITIGGIITTPISRKIDL